MEICSKISLNKKIFLIILVSFMLSLFGIYTLATSCKGTVSECLLQNEKYFNDFHFQFNIIKYVSVYGFIPFEAVYWEDGGYDGISPESSEAWRFHFYRAPLYFLLAGLVYSILRIIGVLPLLSLHILSTVIILVTNIFFFLFIKRVSNFIQMGKKRFILYALMLFVFLPPHLYIALGVQDDVLFYCFFVASLYAYVRLLEKKTKKAAILFGLFIGLSLLSRQSAITMVASLVLILGYYLIKKNYQLMKLYSISLFTSLVVGGFSFVRNKILFGSIFGDLLTSYGNGPGPLENNLAVFLRGYRGFWGGIEGGNNNTYFLLVFVCLALTILTIYGLFVYKKEINEKLKMNFLIVLFFIILLFAVDWACKLSIFLTTAKCIGYAVQSRFIISLCPIIALLSSFSLINLEKRYKRLSKIVHFFVILTAVLFSIDFITALLKL